MLRHLGKPLPCFGGEKKTSHGTLPFINKAITQLTQDKGNYYDGILIFKWNLQCFDMAEIIILYHQEETNVFFNHHYPAKRILHYLLDVLYLCVK